MLEPVEPFMAIPTDWRCLQHSSGKPCTCLYCADCGERHIGDCVKIGRLPERMPAIGETAFNKSGGRERV